MGLFELAGHDRTKRAIDRAAQQQLQLAANQQGTVASLQERVRKLEEHARRVHEYESWEVSRYADLKHRVELMEADVAALPHPEALRALHGEIEANGRRVEMAMRAIDGLKGDLHEVGAHVRMIENEQAVERDDFPQFPPTINMDAIPEQEQAGVLELLAQDADLKEAGYALIVDEPGRWRIVPDDDNTPMSTPPALPTAFLEQVEWLVDHAQHANDTEWQELMRVWKERLKFLRQAISRGHGGVWKDVDWVIQLQERIDELEEQIDAPSQEA